MRRAGQGDAGREALTEPARLGEPLCGEVPWVAQAALRPPAAEVRPAPYKLLDLFKHRKSVSATRRQGCRGSERWRLVGAARGRTGAAGLGGSGAGPSSAWGDGGPPCPRVGLARVHTCAPIHRRSLAPE